MVATFVAPENVGNGLRANAETKKLEIAIDSKTISVNARGELVANIPQHTVGTSVDGVPIGMLGYFATDEIPDGWISFNNIHTLVTETDYPELHAMLTAQYGSIDNVPTTEGIFIRNIGGDLHVGNVQKGSLGSATEKDNFQIQALSYETTGETTGLMNTETEKAHSVLGLDPVDINEYKDAYINYVSTDNEAIELTKKVGEE